MLSIALATLLAGADTNSLSRPPDTCGHTQPTAEERLPSTISTMRLVEAWLATAKTGDDAAFIRFVKERGPVLLGEPERWLDLRNLLRDVDYCGLKSADADGVAFWMFDPNFDSFGVAQFKLPATAADKITFTGLWLTGEVPPGALGPPKLAPPDLVKAVQARLSHYAESDRFSGAVLIARQGRVLFQQARGFANRETRTPNDLNSQFRFGSMGKMFTIIAIAQLLEQGKIDVAAPIGRYLPDYPNQEVAAKVTVANLLTHTGGTGDIFGPEFDAHKAALRDLKDYVDLYGKRPLEFSPGSRFSYSNYGFILLGRIVEAVSNLSYDAYLQRNVFGPAGMRSTGNLPETTPLHRAVAYMGSGVQLRRADATLPFRGTSAGGGYSTVGDLNRFADALTAHRLLRADTLQQLMSGGVKGKDGEFFRYDFGGSIDGAGPFFGHGGGAPGMSGMLYHFLDSGYTVIALANRDPGTAESIATFVAHRLPGR
jgi:D-alanyl-D-alanine carboxypeptidase